MWRKPKLLRWTRETVAPTLDTVTFVSDNADDATAKIWDTLTLAFTPSEDIIINASTISWKNVTFTKIDTLSYTVDYVMVEWDASWEVAFTIDFRDIIWNVWTQVVATTWEEIVTADCTRPTATLLYSVDAWSTYASTISTKDADTLKIKATFSEAVADAPIAKIAIDGEVLVATNMTKISTTVYTYDLDVPAWDIDATCTVTLVTDVIWNVITTDAVTNSTFTIDNTVPTLESAAYDTDTQLTITMDEFMDATSVTNADDGWFVVAETDAWWTTYAVSAVAAWATADLVVLTIADASASVTPWLTVTYATGWNGTATDSAGNVLATDATWVLVPTWA